MNESRDPGVRYREPTPRRRRAPQVLEEPVEVPEELSARRSLLIALQSLTGALGAVSRAVEAVLDEEEER